MNFEEKFGVKVDAQIPDEDKQYFFEQWERWLTKKNAYVRLNPNNVLTRYEHFLIGSGAGRPPDPFKPLAAIAQNSNLEAVIQYRKEHYPAGSTLNAFSSDVPNFQELTGLNPEDYHLLVELPVITPDGRVGIPRVVGVVNNKTEERVGLNGKVIKQLKLTRENIFGPVKSGAYIKEVFDFDKGYRLELASKPQDH